MKIDHVTFAAAGGAGRVAHLLQESQEENNHDSRLLTLSASGLRQEPFRYPALTVRSALDQILIKEPKSPGMISVIRRDFKSNLQASIRTGSLIHLHWVEGVINHNQIAHLLDKGRKIVWTLHDSAPFTGGCHSPMGCSGFTQSCNQCPQVRPAFVSLISNSHKELTKNRFFSENLRLVAPTKALAKDSFESTLFRGRDIEVIGNPISKVFFTRRDKSAARRRLGISDSDIVGIAIAEQLDNPLKQIPHVLEVFFQATQDLAQKAVFILIGRNGKSLAARNSDCIWVGQLSDEGIAETVPAADFLVSASLSESAGMTVVEAAALGVPAIAIRNGGSDELIEHGEDGILVTDLNEMKLAIRAAIQDLTRLKAMGERASIRARKSQADLVSAEYLKLYAQLLADNGV